MVVGTARGCLLIYTERGCPPTCTRLRAHKAAICALAALGEPGSRVLVSGDTCGMVCLWDLCKPSAVNALLLRLELGAAVGQLVALGAKFFFVLTVR